MISSKYHHTVNLNSSNTFPLNKNYEKNFFAQGPSCTSFYNSKIWDWNQFITIESTESVDLLMEAK